MSDVRPAPTNGLVADRVVLVSGVGPGLGRDLALALARAGADVVLAARTPSTLEQVADEVRALGRRALPVPTDITDPAQCQRLVEAAVGHFGQLHVLVSSAFVQPPFEHVEHASEETVRSSFEVNFFGHVWLTQAAVPHLRASAPASIVFINTMSTRRTRAKFGLYTAAKMALLGLAKVLAVELGPDRIRVNSVHPGYIWGESVVPADPSRGAGHLVRRGLRRGGQPDGAAPPARLRRDRPGRGLSRQRGDGELDHRRVRRRQRRPVDPLIGRSARRT